MLKKFIGAMFISYMGGFVTCMNLTKLLDAGDSYEAAWWKVSFSVFIAAASGIMWWSAHRHMWE